MSTEPLAADPFAAEPAYLALHTALLAEPFLAPLLLDESAKNHKSCIAVLLAAAQMVQMTMMADAFAAD